jgi:hypothetical protein
MRRRVVRGKYGRRGRSGAPKYGIKNLLVRNLEHLSPAQFAKARHGHPGQRPGRAGDRRRLDRQGETPLRAEPARPWRSATARSWPAGPRCVARLTSRLCPVIDPDEKVTGAVTVTVQCASSLPSRCQPSPTASGKARCLPLRLCARRDCRQPLPQSLRETRRPRRSCHPRDCHRSQ